jgi:predicted transcriptional regulator
VARPRRQLPTDAELKILDVLWTRGPSTVRDVHRTLTEAACGTVGGAAGPGYTTVLKLMQIMVEKGSLRVDRSVRPIVYRPARTRAATQKRLVGDLLDRAFSGSPGSLVLHALSTKKATADERQRIRELLDRLEDGEDEEDGGPEPDAASGAGKGGSS